VALETQIIEIPLYGGLDTKSDDKNTPQGLSLQMDNAIMQHTGIIQKRYGYTELAIGTTTQANLVADDELSEANSIHTYGDQ